jgi:hypothetical protein
MTHWGPGVTEIKVSRITAFCETHFGDLARRFLRKVVARLTPFCSKSLMAASCFPAARVFIRSLNAKSESASICWTGFESLPRPLRTNWSRKSLDPFGGAKAGAKHLRTSPRPRKYQPRGLTVRAAMASSICAQLPTHSSDSCGELVTSLAG